MRKWIWTALLVLPLIAAGGLVYAHAGSEEPSAAAIEKTYCPLQRLHDFLTGIGAKQAADKKPNCPLQRLIKHLHS